jgi:excisionase family DNA binding protein
MSDLPEVALPPGRLPIREGVPKRQEDNDMTVDLGMTVKQAAVALGLPENTVYLLCASGRLPHRRMGTTGKQIRITQRHIERYLESCEVDETNAPGISKPEVPPVRRRPLRATKRDPNMGLDGTPIELERFDRQGEPS